jgi:hypothetical protein
VFDNLLVALSGFWNNKWANNRKWVRASSILRVGRYLLFSFLWDCLVLNLTTYNPIRLYRVITVDIWDIKTIMGYLSSKIPWHWLNEAIFVVLFRVIGRCLFYKNAYRHIFLLFYKILSQWGLHSRIVDVQLGDIVLGFKLLMLPQFVEMLSFPRLDDITEILIVYKLDLFVHDSHSIFALLIFSLFLEDRLP